MSAIVIFRASLELNSSLRTRSTHEPVSRIQTRGKVPSPHFRNGRSHGDRKLIDVSFEMFRLVPSQLRRVVDLPLRRFGVRVRDVSLLVYVWNLDRIMRHLNVDIENVP